MSHQCPRVIDKRWLGGVVTGNVTVNVVLLLSTSALSVAMVAKSVNRSISSSVCIKCMTTVFQGKKKNEEWEGRGKKKEKS